MTCNDYFVNLSATAASEAINITASRGAPISTAEQNLIKVIMMLFHQVGLPVICLFGVIGNILNLFILTRKQLQCSMDRMEKSAHIGLVALAASDMLFCLILFPMPFLMPINVIFSQMTVGIRYHMYHEWLLNTFLFTSTWLTVAMATGRYFAVCHPIHARGFIDLRCTKILILSIYVISILFNLPLFWRYSISIMQNTCGANCTCNVLRVGPIFMNKSFMMAYNMIWAVFGTFIPFGILTMCNICLIRALRKSLQMRRQHSTHKNGNSGHHLTPTLIAIIILFLVLVFPSEFLKFIQHLMVHKNLKQLVIASRVTNFLEAVNFAINFLLYFLINSHFRKLVKRLLCCKKPRPIPKQTITRVTFAHSSSDAETMV